MNRQDARCQHKTYRTQIALTCCTVAPESCGLASTHIDMYAAAVHMCREQRKPHSSRVHGLMHGMSEIALSSNGLPAARSVLSCCCHCHFSIPASHLSDLSFGIFMQILARCCSPSAGSTWLDVALLLYLGLGQGFLPAPHRHCPVLGPVADQAAPKPHRNCYLQQPESGSDPSQRRCRRS